MSKLHVPPDQEMQTTRLNQALPPIPPPHHQPTPTISLHHQWYYDHQDLLNCCLQRNPLEQCPIQH